MERRPDRVRERVRSSYGRAIREAAGRGRDCCGSGRGPAEAKACGADYGPADVDSLPPAVLESSFGCGNPLAFADVRPGDVVLDLGSGAGLDLCIAARRVGPGGRAIGVDMTDGMIVEARENAARSGLGNVELRRGLIEQLPVEAGSVDWVISNCVINLSPEKSRVFAEIARVLRPGGRFSISDIVVERLPAWVRDEARFYDACVAGAIPERAYLDGLRGAGLAGVEVAERRIYDAESLETLLRDEVGSDGETLVGAAARELAGQVWSARFVGFRPAG